MIWWEWMIWIEQADWNWIKLTRILDKELVDSGTKLFLPMRAGLYFDWLIRNLCSPRFSPRYDRVGAAAIGRQMEQLYLQCTVKKCTEKVKNPKGYGSHGILTNWRRPLTITLRNSKAREIECEQKVSCKVLTIDVTIHDKKRTNKYFSALNLFWKIQFFWKVLYIF